MMFVVTMVGMMMVVVAMMIVQTMVEIMVVVVAMMVVVTMVVITMMVIVVVTKIVIVMHGCCGDVYPSFILILVQLTIFCCHNATGGSGRGRWAWLTGPVVS